MSLAEHLATTLPKCRYAHVYVSLDADDRGTLDGALDNPGLSTAQLARALRAEGHQIGEDSIRRHRTGDCACP
jgi:hypothetical protein